MKRELHTDAHLPCFDLQCEENTFSAGLNFSGSYICVTDQDNVDDNTVENTNNENSCDESLDA